MIIIIIIMIIIIMIIIMIIMIIIIIITIIIMIIMIFMIIMIIIMIIMIIMIIIIMIIFIITTLIITIMKQLRTEELNCVLKDHVTIVKNKTSMLKLWQFWKWQKIIICPNLGNLCEKQSFNNLQRKIKYQSILTNLYYHSPF